MKLKTICSGLLVGLIACTVLLAQGPYVRGPRGGCYETTRSGSKKSVDRALCDPKPAPKGESNRAPAAKSDSRERRPEARVDSQPGAQPKCPRRDSQQPEAPDKIRAAEPMYSDRKAAATTSRPAGESNTLIARCVDSLPDSAPIVSVCSLAGGGVYVPSMLSFSYDGSTLLLIGQRNPGVR